MRDFNAAALTVINFLKGDCNTGKCFCPCHPDGQKPSLQVNNGDKQPVVLHCWGRNNREHDLEIIAHLKAHGAWPTSDSLTREQLSTQAGQARSPEDRRRYALGIWEELRKLKRQRDLTFLLENYLQRRGIKEVPSTALVVVPIGYEGIEVSSHDPGMVLPVRNKEGKFQGIHVVWLNADMTAKCEAEPQRQSFGLIKGNYVQLTKIDWSNPPAKLIIGEGPETVLAMMQLTGLPGIATGGKPFFAPCEPPRCDEYIIAIDNDADGGSRQDAEPLAQRLVEVGATVRMAMPEKPEGGKDGYDWNDALVEAVAPGMEALHRDAILQAPLFTASKDDKQVIDKVAKVTDPIEFDRKTKEAAKGLGVTRSAVKEAVAKRREELAKAPVDQPKPDIKKLAASAREIIDCEDVPALFADDIKHEIVGEEKNVKLLYLIGTSRLFDKPMNAAVKGPSSGGKSETRKRVIAYFPSEHVISFTALAPKTLLYMEEGFEHKILSMGEALTGREQEFQDYCLRELMSEGHLRYPVPQKVGGDIVTVWIEKDGPVAFLVTTTRDKLNPENETRMLSLEVNDSPEQTKAVLGKVAQVVGLNKEVSAGDLRPWHDYQRWLAAGKCRVLIPFAETLSGLIDTTKSVRLRRDFSQLLIAIKAHALLHRKHRRRSKQGAIVATIGEDYAAVRELMGDLLATASEIKLRENIEATITAVGNIMVRHGDLDDGVTVREVAQELDLDISGVRRRLKAAADEGYLVNLEHQPRKGSPGRYRLTKEQSRQEHVRDRERINQARLGHRDVEPGERPGELLPTPDALRTAHKAERERRAAEKGDLPAVHPPKIASRSPAQG